MIWQVFKYGDFGEIEHIYTHKDFKDIGIATALLKKLEQKLHELGVIGIKTNASSTAKPFF